MGNNTTQPVKKHLGKIVKEVKVFDVPGTFESMYAAERWLRENGYSYGSTGRGSDPVAILKGGYDLPQKWHNISALGRSIVDGVMYCGRDEKATVYIFN